MGKTYSELDDSLRAFLAQQQMFFVATAPGDSAGHVNLSPKGLDSLRVLDPKRIAYIDYVGSGAETIAHLRDNGRIVIMLCAFAGPPKILRLYGRGSVLEPQDGEFAALVALFPGSAPARSIIRVDIERIADSCGYGVPEYQHVKDRARLVDWATRKGENGLRAYQEEKNAVSIDGLPALRWTSERAGGDK